MQIWYNFKQDYIIIMTPMLNWRGHYYMESIEIGNVSDGWQKSPEFYRNFARIGYL